MPEFTQWLGDFISNNVFSIVMCGALFWKMNKQDDDHAKEVHELSQIIADNTTAITRLTTYIEVAKGGYNERN